MITIPHWRRDQGMSWYDSAELAKKQHHFIVVTYGSCLYWINGEKVMVSKGDFLLIPSSVPYYGKSIPTVFHEKLHFEVQELPPFSGITPTSKTIRLPLFQSDSWIKSKAGCYDLSVERIRTALKELEEGLAFAEGRLLAALLETLTLWSRELEQGEMTEPIVQHVEKMKKYIAEHYRQAITKQHLGSCIKRSPNYAAAIFSKVTGQPISAYVHAARIKTAVYLLQDSLLTVSEIAEYLGYRDVTYFQRIFKRMIGHPPSVLMKDRPPTP
ncbi:helix-turn-helix domain-containing protein [Paenibacillus sp. GXUN7292]|uniref:AraC family transcriptional regulator n=1 Tax=Paenibacillus sp. GXUN7292 TaxID=3422499 RepID=UPI003D7E79B8